MKSDTLTFFSDFTVGWPHPKVKNEKKKIPYARTDPWPETPDLRVICFGPLPLNVERIQGVQYSYCKIHEAIYLFCDNCQFIKKNLKKNVKKKILERGLPDVT